MKKVVLALMLVLTGRLAVAAQPDLKTSFDAVVEAERAFSRASVETGMSVAFSKILAPDAVVMRPTPQAGAKWLQVNHDSPVIRISWEPDDASVAHSGEFGWVLGRWMAEKLDTKQYKYGHFLTAWRKQPDGSWKVIGDTAVVSSQPDPAATEPIALQTPAFTGGKGKTDVAAVRNALLEQDRKLTASAGKSDATEYLSFLAPDALVLRTRKDPQHGQAAFDTLKASWTPLPWHQGGGEMSNAGDMAFTYGVREDPDTPDRTESGYMRIWERQKDGSWKVVIDLVNGLPPHTGIPPATPTPEAPKQPG